MVDIAPDLLEQIQTDFASRVAGDSKIQALYRKITEGAATYADAEEYAFQVGQALSQALGKVLTPNALPDGRMYYNIADRVLRPMLQEDHNLVSDAAAAVQKALNEKAGIGIKPQTVPINTDRVDGIIDIASNAEQFEDVAHGLDAQIKNFSMNVVDETLRANVEFQGKSGMSPKVIRRATSKCCDWCSRLAGKYEYPDVPKDVYRRHNNCRCVVEYDPGEGKRQNVHTKKWTEDPGRDTIESRKRVGIKSLPEELAEHPKRLASFTPASLRDRLEAEGFEVKPLRQGSLKNVPFDDGGGYKVNFPDGGILQYHPEKGSHHNGAYYKISTGKGGRHRYELDGTEQGD